MNRVLPFAIVLVLLLVGISLIGEQPQALAGHGCRGCDGCFGCNGCHGCDGCYGCDGCFGCNGCRGVVFRRGCCGCNGSVTTEVEAPADNHAAARQAPPAKSSVESGQVVRRPFGFRQVHFRR